MQGKSLWFGNWDGVDRSVGMGSRDKAVRTGRSFFGGRPPLIRLVTETSCRLLHHPLRATMNSRWKGSSVVPSAPAGIMRSRGIGIRLAERFLPLLRQSVEERSQAAARRPFRHRVLAAERVHIRRLPHVERRDVRAQQIPVFRRRQDPGRRADVAQILGPGSGRRPGRNGIRRSGVSCIAGICTASTPPGASNDSRRGNSSRMPVHPLQRGIRVDQVERLGRLPLEEVRLLEAAFAAPWRAPSPASPPTRPRRPPRPAGSAVAGSR